VPASWPSEMGRHFATVEDLINAAQGELRPQTTMLVKGSRFMRMERVVQALAASHRQREGTRCPGPDQWLAQDVRAFNVFQYITLRAVLATLTALAISLVAGPLVIRKLTTYKIGQAVRDDGPQSHLTKAGTPTMGGALVLLSILITTLLWGDLSNRFVWVVLVSHSASARSAGSTTTARS